MALAKLASIALAEGASAVDMGTAITNGSDTFFGVVSSTFNFITGNPLMILLLVGGTIIPLGIGLFKRLKRASK